MTTEIITPPDSIVLANNELADELAALVAHLAELDGDAVRADVPFSEVGIDSLMAIEIAVHVEQRYGTTFTEQDLGTLTCFADLVALTQAHVTRSRTDGH